MPFDYLCKNKIFKDVPNLEDIKVDKHMNETHGERGIRLIAVDRSTEPDRVAAPVDLDRSWKVHEEPGVGAGDRHVRQHARHGYVQEAGPIAECAGHRGGLSRERGCTKQRRQHDGGRTARAT